MYDSAGAIIPINENSIAIIPINGQKRPDSACIGRIGKEKRLTALILFQEIFQRGQELSNLCEIMDKEKIERSFISL